MKEAQLVKSFPVDTGVWGIAVIGDQLFVALHEKDVVEVYDTKTFERCEQLFVDGLGWPADMIADAPDDRVLIISDRYGKKLPCGTGNPGIYIVSIDSKSSQGFHSFETQPGGLSLTKDRRLVVISEKKNEVHEIVIFRRTGMSLIQLNTIDLDLSSVERYVLKAVELPGEREGEEVMYAVTQTHKSTHTYHVLLVNSGGSQCGRFPQTGDREEFNMREPFSLVLDANGYLMVNDCLNHRVLLLDQSLNFIREIISDISKSSSETPGESGGTVRVQLNCPRRICLDEPNGMLYVGQGGSGSKDASSSKPVFGQITVCRVKSLSV